MTKADIEAVFERVRTWPIERQEDAVNVLLRMEAIGTEPYELDDEERAALDEALAEADRGEFASDEEVAAFFAKHRA